MGKTIRRFTRNESSKDIKKKDKYKVNDQYKGQSLDDVDNDDDDDDDDEDIPDIDRY